MSRKPILFMDDEVAVRVLMSEVLETLGYDLYPCESPYEAVMLLLSNDFCGAIFDIRMPGWDAEKFFDAIRFQQPNIPVGIYSGYITDEVKETCGSLNIPCLSKPATLDQLTEFLEILVSPRQHSLN